MRNPQGASLTWYRLDNAAKIFPCVSNAENTNVFRLVCELKEEVDPVLLQQALEAAVAEYPSFRMKLKKGFFWYFLEHNPALPRVSEDDSRPCGNYYQWDNQHYLFKLSFFGRRINFEVFHVLADGSGSIRFFNYLLYQYLRLAHPEALQDILPPPDSEAQPSALAEDGFKRYYDRKEKSSPFIQKAYHMSGQRLPCHKIKLIQGSMPLTKVLALAREKGVSLTAYLTALLILSVHAAMPKRRTGRSIVVNIPVDLRRLFPSYTARNFFACIVASHRFSEEKVDFDTLVHSVSVQLQAQQKAQNLSKKINFTVATERNLLVRFIPLFLKRLALKVAYAQTEAAFTTALSNIGRITLGEKLDAYIDHFEVVLSVSKPNPCKFGVCSFKDTLMVSYSSSLAETDIPRYFFRFLAEQGVDVVLQTNEVAENEILP
ncbi:MAG TPA: hypothetical protein H9671_07310 [Firmicutes bacterium]|nr:hypothetical protein [Bacillota bacterium]